MRKRVVAGMVLLVAGTTAQEVLAEQQAVEVESVEVTAKREREPVYSPFTVPESASATVEEFSSEEIRAVAPSSVYDVAALSPGAQVTFQGRKGLNTLQLRGGDTVGVILDGVYIPWSQASRMLAQFPVDAIESIRIVRDSSAVTLGPLVPFSPAVNHDNAPTPGQGSSNQGFMVITTKRGRGFEVGGIAEYGSHNSRNFQLYHGYTTGPFSYRLAGTVSGTDGRDTWNNAASTRSILANGNYDGAALKADFMVYFADSRREIQRSTKESTTSNALWYYDPMRSLQLSVNLHKPWNNVHTTSLSYARGRITAHEVLRTAKATPDDISQADQSDMLHLWHVAATADNRFVAGVQGFRWKSPTGQYFYEGIARKEDLVSGYLHDEYRLSERLTLDFGVRVDGKFIEKGSDKYSPLLGGNKKINDEWQQPAITLSLGGSYKLDRLHRLLARFGYTRQAADSFLATVNGSDLDTEERFKYELGVEAGYHPAFNPSLTLFLYDIKNFAYAAATGGSGATAYNIYDSADVIREGIEFSCKGKLPWGFGYNAGYSYITTDRGATNKIKPHHMVNLRLSHSIRGVESNLTLNYVGPYENNFLTTGGIYRPAGDYTRLDLNVSYAFALSGARARATLFGRNLLDDHYVTIAGWRDQGMTWGGKMEVAF